MVQVLVYQHVLGMVCRLELGLELVRVLDVGLEHGQHKVVVLVLVYRLVLVCQLELGLVYRLVLDMVYLLVLVYQQQLYII